MKRRSALQLALATSVCSVNGRLHAASPRKTRIFMLLGRGMGDSERGFIDYLRKAGHDLDLIMRDTGGDISLLPGFVREARQLAPDLIYTWGTPQTLAVLGRHDAVPPHQHITDIPVVFSYVASPVAAKLTPHLSGSGRNFTGVIHIPTVKSQINTLLAYRPCRSIGSLYNPQEPNALIALEALEQELATRSIALHKVAVNIGPDGKPSAASIPGQLSRLARQQVDFLYLGPDTFLAGLNRATVAAVAIDLKLPLFSVTEPIVRENGGLLALASKGYSVGQFAGYKASLVLSGTQAIGQIPIETLRRFSVVLNIETARKLNLYPSLELLRFSEMVRS